MSEDLSKYFVPFDSMVTQYGFDQAVEHLRALAGDDTEGVVAAYMERHGEVVVDTSDALVDGSLKNWYNPTSLRVRWQYTHTNLGLPDSVLEVVDRESDEIVSLLADPKSADIRTRGLVLGRVQSGKTTNFLSVAAKAADAGYELIIILAGVHNSLRRQTQERAQDALVHNETMWWLGTAVGEFYDDGMPLAKHIGAAGHRGLLVVKKHKKVLERLADWLEKECRERPGDMRKRSILVIDDEADQAGLDVGDGLEAEGVHEQMLRIVDLSVAENEHRCAYLAYTATPYANVLTSQATGGLYPRDFIKPLPCPDGYVGAAELLGDRAVGSPIVRFHEPDGTDVMTPDLRAAVCWFVVATAARAALRGNVDDFHSSMLVHTSQLQADHQAYREPIESLLGELRANLAENDELRHTYELRLGDVPARPGGGPGLLDERTATWEEVEPFLASVLDRMVGRIASGPTFKEDGKTQIARSGVIVDNGAEDSVDRLTYSRLDRDEPGVFVIVVGGNTLSRGLTLEGLVCSYFARTSRNYDSLMQMGRWFGFRPGYRHLVRLWTTPTLADWFRELTVVEEEFREELAWMARQDPPRTPADYGARIRQSANMNITRKAAMKSVMADVSYENSRVDPAWVVVDEEGLEHNQTAARALAGALGRPVSRAPHAVFEDVPVEVVRAFLAEYRYHPEEKRVDRDTLLRYIDADTTDTDFWTVVFRSVAGSSGTTFDFGHGVGVVGTARRAQLKNSGHGNIGSTVDSGDQRLDRPNVPLSSGRFRDADESPLLVLYAIDPESPATRNDSDRVPLAAPDVPIAAALFFPPSDTYVQYVAPAIDAAPRGGGDHG